MTFRNRMYFFRPYVTQSSLQHFEYQEFRAFHDSRREAREGEMEGKNLYKKGAEDFLHASS